MAVLTDNAVRLFRPSEGADPARLMPFQTVFSLTPEFLKKVIDGWLRPAHMAASDAADRSSGQRRW